MKKIRLLVWVMLLFSTGIFAQSNYWQSLTAVKNSRAIIVQNKRNLTQTKLFDLNINNLKLALAGSPKRVAGKTSGGSIISFPDADGKYESFKVMESSNMDPALAARYPDIKSYVGKGIEDPTAIIYFSVSPLGLETMLIRADKSVVLIEPYTTDQSTYVVYKKGDKTKSLSKFECRTVASATKSLNLKTTANRPNADDGTLRTFRLALSVTGEYSDFFGGTVAGALAGMNATLTRVNGIFETDFAAHMNLIANDDILIYLDATTDPYSDGAIGAAGAWNAEIQTNLTNVIGSANYDVGHLFGATGGGGNAGCLGCVCKDPVDGSNDSKGRGFTSPNTDAPPVGDEFDLDFVAHEFGHQYGASHTFSYSSENNFTQVEPGSGTTIMSYAGVTGIYDVQPHNSAYFHGVSIGQVTDYIKTTTCQVNTPTGNATPTANAGTDYTIPKGTPFALTGVATDADGDALTYTWEQMDQEIDDTPFPSTTATTGPAFRSFTPTASPVRNFPELATILTGSTATQWEAVPDVARTMNFRLTVRDNHAGGPANNSDDVVITTSAASGPFVVTVPNTAVIWTGNTTQTVTWNVANTTASPVNAANVKISLSTDGGLTFPTVLLASTPNDGSQSITVPNVGTTTARIKVEAVGNIFFDISDVDFTINAINSYTVTATAGANGTIAPAGAVAVNTGTNKTFTIAAKSCYKIADVLVDGVSQGAIATYTFTNVTAAHTISATFTQLNYTITASAGANGSITPNGATVENCGANQTYTIAANSCYQIADVLVDGVSQGAITTYTFTNVTAAHTISASFSVLSYTITATAGANGSISPNGATVVNCGANAVYTITANAGYAVQDVLVDGVSQGAVSTYTFTSVNAPHTITATFVAGAYVVTASAGANGSISPTGAVSVTNGGNQTFTITPNSCYKIADVLVDGISQGAVATYTFTGITSAHTISASFTQLSYTIAASAGANGAISPTGTTSANCGASQTYTITANAGYVIQNVVVDGVSLGALTTYTFTNVTANHTISATFVQNAFVITASSGANGSVSPSGAVSVASGTNKTFTITPNSGYAVQNVLIDGISQGALTTYTFTNVTGNHTISATFVTSACTAPVLTSVVTTVTCKGSKTGSINLTVTGTSPFTYAWTGPNSFTSTFEDIASLGAGTYNVKVTASGGCTASASYAVSEPAIALSASASAGTILCNGSKTSVTVTGTGGTAPYTGTGTFTNQSAGAHTYIVKDAKGCSASVSINISQPSPIHVCVIPGTLCGTGTTSVTVNASGGTAPYTGTGTFTNQSAGSHTYTVTDAKGCTTTKTINIVAGSSVPPAAPVCIIGLANNLCGGGQFLFGVAPMPGVNYTWTVPAGFAVSKGQGSCIVLITVPASFTGQAVIKVAASNACGGTSAQTSLTLYATAPNLSTSIIGPSTVNANQKNVAYILPVLPGKATFTWTVPADATIVKGQGTPLVFVNFGSTSGNVKVKFTNTCGTSPEAGKYVTVKTASAAHSVEDLTVSTKTDFKTYPNPVQSRATVEFNAQKRDNKFEIRITDAVGNTILTKSGLTVAGKNIHQFNMSTYVNGMYLVTLITNNKTETQKLIKEK